MLTSFQPHFLETKPCASALEFSEWHCCPSTYTSLKSKGYTEYLVFLAHILLPPMCVLSLRVLFHSSKEQKLWNRNGLPLSLTSSVILGHFLHLSVCILICKKEDYQFHRIVNRIRNVNMYKVLRTMQHVGSAQ